MKAPLPLKPIATTMHDQSRPLDAAQTRLNVTPGLQTMDEQAFGVEQKLMGQPLAGIERNGAHQHHMAEYPPLRFKVAPKFGLGFKLPALAHGRAPTLPDVENFAVAAAIGVEAAQLVPSLMVIMVKDVPIEKYAAMLDVVSHGQ